MSNSLERLMRLTGWSQRSDRRYDWSRVGAALGTDLPPDYVELIEAFGCGLFDKTIVLLEPGSSRRHHDLIAVTRQERHGLRYLVRQGMQDSWDEDELPSSVRPPNGDPLIVWAVTDYGLNFYWRCSPWNEPERWPVVAVVLGETWHEYDMTATELLEGLLTGPIEHPSWSAREQHRFMSMEEVAGGRDGSSSSLLPFHEHEWRPEVFVSIDLADQELYPRALFDWLKEDEALESVLAAIGVVRSAATGYRTVVEVTLRDDRGLPVLARSVAAWMRLTGDLRSATLRSLDATVSVERATPEAMEELIRTLRTVE